MLSAIEVLRLKQLRFEVASQQVLRVWKPEDLSQPKCQKCNQIGFSTPYQRKEQAVCYCLRCNSYFNVVPSDRICHCSVPGQVKTCHGCPNFDRFMNLVKEQLSDLEHLSLEELLQRQAELAAANSQTTPS